MVAGNLMVKAAPDEMPHMYTGLPRRLYRPVNSRIAFLTSAWSPGAGTHTQVVVSGQAGWLGCRRGDQVCLRGHAGWFQAASSLRLGSPALLKHINLVRSLDATASTA
jgi:hypothetical protein